MYLHRTIEKVTPRLSQGFDVVMLSSMRQAGKRTALKRMCEPSRTCVTLDDPAALDLATNAPRDFFEQYAPPVLIDRAERAPGLFRAIAADPRPGKGGIWLSGPRKLELVKDVGDSPAGRILELQMMPMSLYERNGRGLDQHPYLPDFSACGFSEPRAPEAVWETILQGGWPEALHLNARERRQFFSAFLMNFLEQDIARLWNIGKLDAFRRFMQALALRTGQELRIGELAALAGIDPATAKRWLSVAEASGLVYLLKPLAGNGTRVLTKSPRVYMTDTGLAAFLSRKTTVVELRSDMNAGAFFETFVVTEILKSWLHNGLEPDFHFLRDQKSGGEIDLIIHHEGTWYPMEIKSTISPNSEMAKHFVQIDRLGLRRGTGAVICSTPNRKRFLSEDIITHSVWEI
ncbi:ATP-binding protein [Sutterella sp.]|uniref:ATP-binding protein n=1 Tax=Sutterella sp. TaxID=1981025 RepID=UPI0026DF82B7|nr:DUF4143 domain-containing protein [Sutterella sp.]MDO5532854.1 DUF4143 domain-containing protein [Sutterella sp.]